MTDLLVRCNWSDRLASSLSSAWPVQSLEMWVKVSPSGLGYVVAALGASRAVGRNRPPPGLVQSNDDWRPWQPASAPPGPSDRSAPRPGETRLSAQLLCRNPTGSHRWPLGFRPRAEGSAGGPGPHRPTPQAFWRRPQHRDRCPPRLSTSLCALTPAFSGALFFSRHGE